jgi:hypothetical protein
MKPTRFPNTYAVRLLKGSAISVWYFSLLLRRPLNWLERGLRLYFKSLASHTKWLFGSGYYVRLNLKSSIELFFWEPHPWARQETFRILDASAIP